ncbi:MAG: VOC family protein [bacterium]|nr:VOC family protein [bacterium]
MLQAVWIEFPVKDLERAQKFYQTLFELQPTDIVDDGVRRTTTLTNTGDGGSAGISLNQTANFEPNDKGAFVYLYAGEDLTHHLSRVEPAGGKIITGKTYMEGAGYYAAVQDTEGNVFALYSTK